MVYGSDSRQQRSQKTLDYHLVAINYITPGGNQVKVSNFKSDLNFTIIILLFKIGKVKTSIGLISNCI